MGFPNVDIFLVNKFMEKFAAVQADPEFVINDTFEELSEADRTEIGIYITRKVFTDDLRNRGDGYVYILPHLPLMDMPLPQIGISLGNETAAERYFDDVVGDSTAYPATGTQTHWDVPKGYWAGANYQIDTATATKDEAIWLARLLQRFIMEEQDTLDQIGVKEVSVSLQDMKIDPSQSPMIVFNRQIVLSCKVANTWTKRIPVSVYQTGLNYGIL